MYSTFTVIHLLFTYSEVMANLQGTKSTVRNTIQVTNTGTVGTLLKQDDVYHRKQRAGGEVDQEPTHDQCEDPSGWEAAYKDFGKLANGETDDARDHNWQPPFYPVHMPTFNLYDLHDHPKNRALIRPYDNESTECPLHLKSDDVNIRHDPAKYNDNLCPWYNVANYDPVRLPRVIPEVRCKCSHLFNPIGGAAPKYRFECKELHVKYKVMLMGSGCSYRVTYIKIAIACIARNTDDKPTVTGPEQFVPVRVQPEATKKRGFK